MGGEGDDGGRGRRGRFRSYRPRFVRRGGRGGGGFTVGEQGDLKQQEEGEGGGEVRYGRRNGGFRGGFRLVKLYSIFQLI